VFQVGTCEASRFNSIQIKSDGPIHQFSNRMKDWHKISLVCCSDVAGTGDDKGGERLAQDQSSLLQ